MPDFLKTIRHRPSNARGWPCGSQHHSARHSDATVDRARALRADGVEFTAISAALGVPRSTVEGWTSRRRRTQQPVRIVVTRRARK